jgi:hypothetical protein
LNTQKKHTKMLSCQEKLYTLTELSLWLLEFQKMVVPCLARCFVMRHYTNNFPEVSVCLFTYTVLSRVKAYNIIASIDFSCTVQETYYCNRLWDFANSRSTKPFFMLKRFSCANDTEIIQVSENEFHVPSEEDRSTVSTSRVVIALALLGSMERFISISVLFVECSLLHLRAFHLSMQWIDTMLHI